MNKYIVYHNGIYKKESEVCISFHDLGFQRAYGVFDYMRTYNQKPFQSKWHREKLMHSIADMNIETDFNSDIFSEVLKELFILNKDTISDNTEYGIKTIITGGVDGVPTVLVYLEELDDSVYISKREKGIALLAKRIPRQSATSKNIDYKTLISAKKELQEKNCLEILHRGDTYVYESGTSNLFMIKDGIIITPKERIYSGSTRSFVLELAQVNNLIIEERFITWDEFLDADELFITASKKEILPVVIIHDEDSIFEFPVGNITKQLIELFIRHKFDSEYFD